MTAACYRLQQNVNKQSSDGGDEIARGRKRERDYYYFRKLWHKFE